jgi:hypothetical protein
MTNNCELCGIGNTSIRFEEEKYFYKGHELSLVIQFHLCEYCGSEYANFEDSLQNLRSVQTLKDSIDFPVQNTSETH